MNSNDAISDLGSSNGLTRVYLIQYCFLIIPIAKTFASIKKLYNFGSKIQSPPTEIILSLGRQSRIKNFASSPQYICETMFS